MESLEVRGLLSNLPVFTTSPPPDASSEVRVSTSIETVNSFEVFGMFEALNTFTPAGFTSSSDVEITSQPANSDFLASSPSRIVVRFSRPISSFNLDDFSNDVRIDRVNVDGTTTPWFSAQSTPRQIANNAGGLELTFTELAIPLASPLAEGEYQIVLVGGSHISSETANARWDPYSDFIISTFSIGATSPGGSGEGGSAIQDPAATAYSLLHPNANVQSITDLGTLPSGATVLSEGLNPLTGPSSVDLYRFNVAEGHRWLVGIVAQAQGGGGGFRTTPTLFKINADGTLQAVSLGNPNAGLADPDRNGMSYVGLDAGNYCLAVARMLDSSGSGSRGGGYQLRLEAETADQAASVTGFELNRVNPGDAVPAGLTIQFSSGIALDGFSEADRAAPPLEVVDSNGKVWATLPLRYQDQGNVLTLVFGDRLPAGSYTLRIGSVKGLTDLAGWTPVAPGLPSGVLATWTVASDAVAPPSADLGVVWPLSVQGVSRFSEFADAASSSFHFAVITPGLYRLQSDLARGAAEVRIISADGTVYLDKLVRESVGAFNVLLPVGAYTLEWTGRSAETATLSWTLSSLKIEWESLLNNGVGQWSSLDLGFGSALDGGAQPVSTQTQATNSSPGEAGSVSASTPVASSTAAQTQMTVIAQPLLLAPLPSSPVGMPSTASQAVSVVGPAVEPGATAVAGGSTGLIAGIRYSSTSHDSAAGDATNSACDESSPLAVHSSAAVLKSTSNGATAWDSRRAVDDGSRDADQMALASTDWILGVGQRIQDWLESSSLGGDESHVPEAGVAGGAVVAGLDGTDGSQPREDEQGQVERASFGFPLGVIMTTAILVRAKDPIRRWWKKAAQRPANKVDRPDRFAGGKTGAGRREPRPVAGKETINIMKGPHFAAARARQVDSGSHHLRHRESSHVRQK